jgi:Mn-dependent DtxR family transcriptional regulator
MRREGWLEYEPDGMVRLVADETRLARVLDESDEATGT